MTIAPDISVAVASFRDRAVLDACLASLVAQCARVGAPLVVARADDASSIHALSAAYPSVTFVRVAKGSDLPRIRGAALGASTGTLVALTEDHCVADEDWVARLGAHVGRGEDVIGGSMDNAQRARALDWGAFFAEYGFFSAQSDRVVTAGSAILITGANVAYSRRVLHDVVSWMTEGAWENVVHDRLREGGAVMAFDPAARVGQNLHYDFAAFVSDRYRHGHDYARVRLAEAPGSNRIVRAAATVLLPPVLTLRVARTAIGSRSRALSFARALPFTLAFFAGWAAGEAVGYLKGPTSPPGAR